MATTSMTASEDRLDAHGQETRWVIYEANGAAAMDETAVADAPMRLDHVSVDIAAGAAAENLLIILYDGDGNAVETLDTIAVNGATSDGYHPALGIAMARDWYVSVTWANTGAVAWRLHVTLTTA